MRAVFERVVQLEHQLGRIAQLQAAAELAPEPAARGFEPAQGVFLLFLVEDADINFAVAQIRRGVDAGDGKQRLYARVLERADQIGKLALDLFIDPSNSIGSHSTSF